MRVNMALLLILLSLSFLGAQTRLLEYRETTGEAQKTVLYESYPDRMIILTSEETHRLELDSQGSTISWTGGRGDNQISLTREDRGLFPGTLPWYQSPLCLAGPVSRGEKKILFYIVSADLGKEFSQGGGELTPLVFKAVFEEEEEGLLRYRFTFRDMRSIFWHSTLWFRPSDGTLVRYRETRGGPGTPETRGDLVRESRP